jgi:hypothetical protein
MSEKQIDCPVCGRTFKDGRGLQGHLRFKHELTGQAKDRAMQEALAERDEDPDQLVAELEDQGPKPPYRDTVMQAAEQVREAKQRLREAKARRDAISDVSTRGGALSSLMGRDKHKREVKGDYLDRVDEEIEHWRSEVESRRDVLNNAIEKEAKSR